eukprot:1156061-Pelagomonas_calceolata.AAC.11
MPACIRASRASVCYKCNAPIQCNDWIVPDSVQHYARWVHKQCAHSTSEPATPQAHASSVMQAGKLLSMNRIALHIPQIRHEVLGRTAGRSPFVGRSVQISDPIEICAECNHRILAACLLALLLLDFDLLGTVDWHHSSA